MIYKPFKDLKLSALGMGMMRLPTTGERGPIDEKKAEEMLLYAHENGVNYFDVAYRYHGGQSEPFTGKILDQLPRDSWYIASKLPGHMMQVKDGKIEGIGYLKTEKLESIERIFEDQLERCGVDYFDFYMLHNVCETSYGFYSDKQIRAVEYLIEQKKQGRIKHLGMSAHGRADTIDRFLTEWDCIEFVQIQLNYLDWILQDAGKKYDAIVKHGLPVIVMEPVRGGRLASPGAVVEAMLKERRPNDPAVAWAFRYLQSLPHVAVVLSGMTTMDQLKENIATFSRHDPTSEAENELLARAAASMVSTIPCTACGYCTEGCPQNLDIPKLIALGNEARFEKSATMGFTLDAMSPDEMPSACVECGACVQICPQEIDIPTALKEFAAILG